ncbi:MAG: glycerophosphodiester phosphodiesterase, partial [Lentisphaeria bacterium]|nr:glycerophosphodiester phosphodiesterase [Lentisphaeria bacterium]
MVKWISHRGESLDAPENSLAAFKLSLERKTDGMECDVHL